VSNPCFMCNSHQAEIAQLRRYIAHLEGLLRRAQDHVAREYRHSPRGDVGRLLVEIHGATSAPAPDPT
jgi:hypothetical protein